MHPPSCQPRAYMDEGYKPLKHDIICGRGAEIYFHPGNIAFRNVIDRNLGRYLAASSKFEKSQMVVEILYILGTEPAKFIRFDEHKQRWYTLDDEAAKQKIGQSIRDRTHQLDPGTQAIKAIGSTMTGFARKTMKQKRGSLKSDLASHIVENVDSITLCQINGRMRDHCGKDVSSTRFPFECPTLGSSEDWFTIGGLSTEDSDVVGSIDNIF